MAKYLKLSSGKIVEEAAISVSSGAGDVGLIPALDASGKLAVGFIYNLPVMVKATADQSTTGTTLISSTQGLTMTLAAGTYTFEARLLFSTAATTTGINLGLTASGTLTNAAFQMRIPITTTAITLANGNTIPGSGFSSSGPGVNTKETALIEGIFACATSTTLTIQFASKTNAVSVSIYTGSMLAATLV